MDFAHITCWIFDLDNTLYSPEAQLFAQIEVRMTAYVARILGVDLAEADRLRDSYWRHHGTTLAGLMAEHGVAPGPYLADVHDIDLSVLRPDPALAAAIAALPGRRVVHTNADTTYAARVLRARGLEGLFDALWGVEEVSFHPKPDRRAYDAVLTGEDINPAQAAFFEDDPRNLEVPDALGMTTVLVGPGRHGPDELARDHRHGAHVHHQTNDLTGFLSALVAAGGAVSKGE